MRLKLITAPATEALTVAEVKLHAQIYGDTEDSLITMLIESARMSAEQELHRNLITQTWEMALDAFPTSEIQIPISQSITSIKYLDVNGVEQTVGSSNYAIDDYGPPQWIIPVTGYSWPSTYGAANAVKIKLVTGYGDASDVPACIKNWMLLKIRTAYDNRSQIVIGTNGIVSMPDTFIDSLLDSERVYNRCG